MITPFMATAGTLRHPAKRCEYTMAPPPFMSEHPVHQECPQGVFACGTSSERVVTHERRSRLIRKARGRSPRRQVPHPPTWLPDHRSAG